MQPLAHRPGRRAGFVRVPSVSHGRPEKEKSPPKDDPIHLPEKRRQEPRRPSRARSDAICVGADDTNPTNLDIDHRGRVWICDVKNYRGHRNSRPEGDRILILEDTKGTGVADKVTTFYQGRDVDSAMGICVLGNKVIVSASPNVLVFTSDENDKITRKGRSSSARPASLSTITPPTPSSSVPNGRLYWNFGNEGHSVHDKNGKPVVDLAGNTANVPANRYRQAWSSAASSMAPTSRPLPGTSATTTRSASIPSAHVAVRQRRMTATSASASTTSWSTATSGYVDEMTGAGWQKPRTNLEKDKAGRHWHQNDPGVVPNLLHTGAGSPTGICVYEGSLLPEGVPQSDYPLRRVAECGAFVSGIPDGAGYKVTQTVNILDGAKKNKWFRPPTSAPRRTARIFVTDWYDPGVAATPRATWTAAVFSGWREGCEVHGAKYDFKPSAASSRR